MRPNWEIFDIFIETLTLFISESVSVVWELKVSCSKFYRDKKVCSRGMIKDNDNAKEFDGMVAEVYAHLQEWWR